MRRVIVAHLFGALHKKCNCQICPHFFPLSHKGLDKVKISVYTPNYERTLASTERSSIG